MQQTRFYTFRVICNNCLVCEACGEGANALEAFEHQVANGAVWLWENHEMTVLAQSDTGVNFRFNVYK